ncbi:MAG: ABC transporter permease, partial [Actinobacteria bacterium]|nr:ABC transporter permease [Actinomycetota bacterium]
MSMSTRQRVQARLTRNKVAMVGGVYLLVVVIVALLAPLLAPHDENLATRFQDILFSPSSEYW